MTMFLPKSKLDDILFLDVETVSEASDFSLLDEEWKKLWKKKSKHILKKNLAEITEAELENTYQERAAIFSEYAKIVCISVGYLKKENDDFQLRIKSFYGDDEKALLLEFSALMDKHFDKVNKHFLSGHNIREFDVPFIGRRCLIHGIPLPNLLNLVGKKPWETKHLIDTLELWKFGDYKNFISLDLLAKVMGIPSPKTNMDGSQVGVAYWKEGRLEDIKNYCELDVETSVNVFLKLNGNEIVSDIRKV